MFNLKRSFVLAAAIAASSTAVASSQSAQYEKLSSKLDAQLEVVEALQSQMEQMQSADGDLQTEQKKGKPLKIKGRILTEYVNVIDAKEGDDAEKDYLEDIGGDFRVAQARLYFSGQSEQGLDYKVQLRINNRDYDKSKGSIDTATIKNAYIGYGFENGTYLTAGRFDLPTAALASNYSDGTNEYLDATNAVTDRTFDGIDVAFPVGDFTTVNVYAGQTLNADNIGDVNGLDTVESGSKLFGATGTFDLADGHAFAVGGLAQQTIDSEDGDNGNDTDMAYAIEGAYMLDAGGLSSTLALTYVIDDDLNRAQDASGLNAAGEDLDEWYVAHGHAHYAIPGASEEGWFHSPGVFVEGNYVFGSDVEGNNYGFLVGFDHDVMDLMGMSYEYTYVDNTEGGEEVSGEDSVEEIFFVRSTVKF